MEEQDKLPTSLGDFQKYIDDNNIKSKKEFRERNKYLYNRYNKLFPKDERKLIFQEEYYHDFSNEFNSISDFQNFIDSNNIRRPVDFRKLYPKVYDRLGRTLSSEEKKELVYENKTRSYSDIITIEDLQEYVDLHEVHSRKELHKRFPGLYVKFSKILDNISFKFNNCSLGENFLQRLFLENDIKFVTQKTYSDLKNKLPLRYDFYLLEFNVLVEHQGEGHFGKGRYYSENLLINDKQKYKYAVDNNNPIFYYTIYKSEYRNCGYFTKVIIDPDILIQEIKRVKLTT